MYDENEIISLKWTTRNKKYYESKGYKYTGIGDALEINTKDLPIDSTVKITAYCDGCGKSGLTPFRNYNRILNENGTYKCKTCAIKAGIEERTRNSREKLYELFLEKCHQHDCIPITTREDFGGSKSFVSYICPMHGLQKTLMDNIVGSDAWCYKCGKQSTATKLRLTPEEVKRRIESKNNNILLNPEEYVNTYISNLRIICGQCGEEFTTSLSSMTNSDGCCSKCGLDKSIELMKSKAIIYYDRFKEMCLEENYTLLSTIEEYENSSSKLRFICPKHGEQAVSYAKFSTGQRCPECGKEQIGKSIMLTPDEVKGRIEAVNNNVLLNPEEYVGNGTINLKIRCSCGNVFTTSLVNYERQNVTRCQECTKKISKGELKMREVFDRYHVDYVFQKTFDECKDKRVLPFDFYLPELNRMFEFDGIYHYEPVFGQEQLEYTLRHDRIKDEYCEKNGIKMTRIPYWEFHNIETIIREELNLPKIKLIKYSLNN